jgi:hypothetical protein
VCVSVSVCAKKKCALDKIQWAATSSHTRACSAMRTNLQGLHPLVRAVLHSLAHKTLG